MYGSTTDTKLSTQGLPVLKSWSFADGCCPNTHGCNRPFGRVFAAQLNTQCQSKVYHPCIKGIYIYTASIETHVVVKCVCRTNKKHQQEPQEYCLKKRDGVTV